MSDWISVEDRLPPEPKGVEQIWVDVWAHGERYVDANYRDGKFYNLISDYDGDYSHKEEIEGVTHWSIPEPPKAETAEEMPEFKGTMSALDDLCSVRKK